MPEFRTQKESDLWAKLLKEIGDTNVGGQLTDAQVLKKKTDLLVAAVAMMPYEKGVTDNLRAAVFKLRAQADKARTEKQQSNAITDARVLERQLVTLGQQAQTHWAKQLKRYEKEDKEKAQGLDKGKELKIIRAKLLELADQEKKGRDVTKIRHLLAESVRVLDSKDKLRDVRFKELQDQLNKALPDDLSDRLSRISEVIEDEAERSREFRARTIQGLKDTASAVAWGVMDRIGVGRINVGNLVRITSSLARFTGRTFSALGGVATGAGRYMVTRTAARRALVEDARAMPAKKTEIEEVREEKKADERRDFLSMFRKHLKFMENLTKTKDEQQADSFLSRFGSMIGGLLSMVGVKGLGTKKGGLGWGAMLTGMLGLGIAGKGLISTMSSTIGNLFKLAAAKGGGVLKWLGKAAVRFLPLILKRAVVFIPVIGTLLAAVLWGKDIYDAVEQFVSPYIKPMLEKFQTWISETWQWTKDKFATTVETVRNFVDPIKEKVVTRIESIVGTVKGFVDPVVGAVNSVVKGISEFLDNPLKHLKEMLSWLAKKAEGVPGLGTVLKSIPSMLDRGSQLIAPAKKLMNETIIPKATSAINSATSFVSSTATSAMQAGSGAVGSLKASVSSAWNSATETASSNWKTLKSGLGKLFTKSSNVKIDGIHPALQERFSNAVSDYRLAGGKQPVVISSGYRTSSEQADLFRRYGPGRAAPPGRSMHEQGLAIDASSSALNEMDRMGLLAKHGLTRPVKGEAWHVQPAGLSRDAAGLGIFSADAARQQMPSTMPTITPVIDTGVAAKGPVRTETAPQVKESVQMQGSVTTKGNAQATSQRVSPDSIPTFSYSDGSFFAANLGLFGGASGGGGGGW